jgi:hypothetical protein
MKSRLKGFGSYLMKLMSYQLLFGEKQTLYIWKKIKIMLKFNKNVLINKL